MKNQWRHNIQTIDDVLESLDHGEKLTKVIAFDRSTVGGDYSVELHGFVTESGKLIILSEKIGRVTFDGVKK